MRKKLLQSFDVAGDFVGQNRHNGQGQGKGWDKVNNITTWSKSHQGKNKKGNVSGIFSNRLLVTMGPSYLGTRAISAQCTKLPSSGHGPLPNVPLN